MRFKGKIDLWFIIIMLLGEALLIGALFSPEEGIGISVAVTIFYNAVFLPFVFRNYVEVSDDKLTVVFGFGKESLDLTQVQKIYETKNPIASSAASLDRIVIKGRQKTLICAVKEKEAFLTYLKEKNPQIEISDNGRGKESNLVSKVGKGFCLILFVIVGVLLVTGEIRMEYKEESVMIKASYWYDKEINYADIESIEYRDEKVSGSRTGGFASFRLLMGDFKNNEFGNYTRYTYANCDAGVILLVNGREVVISGKDKESTKGIYEVLIDKCGM